MPAAATRPKTRAKSRAVARERRAAKRERRRTLLDLVVAGYAYEHIAERFEISTATVRREIDRALAAQAPGSAQRYIALQLARLQKAMLVVDDAMDNADLRAIPALATLLAEFDRYHGLAAIVGARGAVDLQKEAPKALKSPAPLTE
jgi:DNA-binding CsgD family transcriptional regulator